MIFALATSNEFGSGSKLTEVSVVHLLYEYNNLPECNNMPKYNNNMNVTVCDARLYQCI